MKWRVAAVLGAPLLAGCLFAAPHTKTPPTPEKNSGDTFVELNGTWVRVRDTGGENAGASSRRPILLVHGYASRLESWAAVQPRLAQQRRVVSFDQRGFGMSERTAGDYGPAPHARDVIQLAQKLGLHKPLLVGHSYGGGVILKAALEAPELFSGLVLIDAFATEEQVPPSFQWAKVPGLGEFLFATQFKEVVGEKYVLAFHDKQRFASAASVDEFRSNMLKPGAVYSALAVVRGMDYAPDQVRYRDIGLPSVIIWGEEDRVTPLDAGKQLAGLVDSARLEVLTACGHVPLWERPQAVVRIIEEHLADIEGTRRKRPRSDVTSTPNAGVATP